MDDVAKTNDTTPTWGSMWQVTLTEFDSSEGPLAAVGVFECEAPSDGVIMDVHCVGRRLFLTVGILEGEEQGPKTTRKIQVWAAGDRFPIQETGLYVGAFVWCDHLFYAFDSTDSVIEKLLMKSKVNNLIGSLLSTGLVGT